MFITPILLAQIEDQNKYCLKCHSMRTLSVKDDQTGRIRSFAINVNEFSNSHHGELLCDDCHNTEYANIPHAMELKKEKLDCIDCHDKDLEFTNATFGAIENEFNESIHHEKSGDNFSCVTCHDPHTMKLRRSVISDIRENIIPENQACIECHELKYQLREGDLKRIDLTLFHKEQISNYKNWSNKKCVECHSEKGEESLNHNIKKLGQN